MKTIKLHCTDNGKLVDAKVVEHSEGWLTVSAQPGDLRLTLKKTKADTYVGNMAGYEFVYKQK